MAAKSRKLLFAILYTIYSFDLMGLVFVFVIFSPLILDPTTSLVAAGTPTGTRDLIIGFLFASYPLTQLVGAPMLGEISDRFGRRRVLVFATAGTGVATLLSAIAIDTNSLWLLFVSRLFAGFLAGNLTVAMAAVADNTSDQERGRYMSAFSIFAGLGWTVGPLLGALLSKVSYSAAFWGLGIIFLALAGIVRWVYPEQVRAERKPSLDLGEAFINLIEVFKVKAAVPLLLIYLFQLIGWVLFQSFLAPWAIQRFEFTETWESVAYAVSSFAWMVGGLVASQWLLKKYAPRLTALVPGIAVVIAIFWLVIVSHSTGIWWALTVANLSEAIFFSCMITLASLVVGPKMQGKIFGTVNAGLALALLIGPLISGWLVTFWINLPFLVSTIVMLVMFGFYVVWLTRSRGSVDP